jgi:hypothetical protein
MDEGINRGRLVLSMQRGSERRRGLSGGATTHTGVSAMTGSAPSSPSSRSSHLDGSSGTMVGTTHRASSGRSPPSFLLGAAAARHSMHAVAPMARCQ